MNTLLVRVSCALIFLIFTFVYLFCYQADIMVVAQHVASGGQTHYVPLMGAVLITIALYFIHLGVYAITKLRKRTHALTYLPSLLILAFITSLSSDVRDKIELGCWVWVFPLALVLYAFVAYIARNYQEIETEPSAGGLYSRFIWINLSVLLAMFVAVGLIGNHDEEFHKRAKVETLIADGKYDEAYNLALTLGSNDSSAFMLRACALSGSKKMGEKLFEVPLTSGVNGIVPDSINNVRTLVLPEKEIQEKARYNLDYFLCRQLLDKNLKAFMFILKRYYSLSGPLPKHYREALVLYINKYGSLGKGLSFSDEKLNEEYRAFSDAYIRYDMKTLKRYKSTYWYYYECVTQVALSKK